MDKKSGYSIFGELLIRVLYGQSMEVPLRALDLGRLSKNNGDKP